jgi:hypothetical protein
MPALLDAHCLRERDWVIVWDSVAKGALGAMKKVLTVEKANGANGIRELRHSVKMLQKAEPRQRPFGVSGGAETVSDMLASQA